MVLFGETLKGPMELQVGSPGQVKSIAGWVTVTPKGRNKLNCLCTL